MAVTQTQAIEWEEFEPDYLMSLCGRFSLRRDQTYDVFHLHCEESGHYLDEGSMTAMTRAAAAHAAKAA